MIIRGAAMQGMTERRYDQRVDCSREELFLAFRLSDAMSETRPQIG